MKLLIHFLFSIHHLRQYSAVPTRETKITLLLYPIDVFRKW
jgi:hypothetical protein